MAEVISSRHSICIALFDAFDAALHDALAGTINASTQEELGETARLLVEQLGRFRVWAGSTGAHRVGTMSLDHKLREASHVHNRVIELLQELEEFLIEGMNRFQM